MKKMEAIFYIFLIICTGFISYHLWSKNQIEKEYLRKSIEVKKLEIELLTRKTTAK